MWCSRFNFTNSWKPYQKHIFRWSKCSDQYVYTILITNDNYAFIIESNINNEIFFSGWFINRISRASSNCFEQGNDNMQISRNSILALKLILCFWHVILILLSFITGDHEESGNAWWIKNLFSLNSCFV